MAPVISPTASNSALPASPFAPRGSAEGLIVNPFDKDDIDLERELSEDARVQQAQSSPLILSRANSPIVDPLATAQEVLAQSVRDQAAANESLERVLPGFVPSAERSQSPEIPFPIPAPMVDEDVDMQDVGVEPAATVHTMEEDTELPQPSLAIKDPSPAVKKAPINASTSGTWCFILFPRLSKFFF